MRPLTTKNSMAAHKFATETKVLGPKRNSTMLYSPGSTKCQSKVEN
jgi:hypothetical protein